MVLLFLNQMNVLIIGKDIQTVHMFSRATSSYELISLMRYINLTPRMPYCKQTLSELSVEYSELSEEGRHTVSPAQHIISIQFTF